MLLRIFGDEFVEERGPKRCNYLLLLDYFEIIKLFNDHYVGLYLRGRKMLFNHEIMDTNAWIVVVTNLGCGAFCEFRYNMQIWRHSILILWLPPTNPWVAIQYMTLPSNIILEIDFQRGDKTKLSTIFHCVESHSTAL